MAKVVAGAFLLVFGADDALDFLRDDLAPVGARVRLRSRASCRGKAGRDVSMV